MTFRFIHASVLFTAVALSACGGGGGGGGQGSEQGSASDGSTRSALLVTNLGTSPWGTTVQLNDAATQIVNSSKRWTLPIPVKTNGDTEAIAAMDEIERRLGVQVFDRTSIANTPSSEIVRGVNVVRGGGGCIGSGASCGSVTFTRPNEPPAPSEVGVISQALNVNLGGFNLDQQRDLPSNLEVAIHEFGHALGMLTHFEGFGDGSAISPLFWRTLRTLYVNQVNTKEADIVLATP